MSRTNVGATACRTNVGGDEVGIGNGAIKVTKQNGTPGPTLFDVEIIPPTRNSLTSQGGIQQWTVYVPFRTDINMYDRITILNYAGNQIPYAGPREVQDVEPMGVNGAGGLRVTFMGAVL